MFLQGILKLFRVIEEKALEGIQNRLSKYNPSRFFNPSSSLMEILLPLLLVIFIVIRFFRILDNFWLFDDPLILKHAVLYRPWEYFFVPTVWQKGTMSNFTPWIIFSFALDWKIFGLHPFGFYLHHLMSLCVLSVLAYFVLRLWFSTSLSFWGVLLFAASPPFADSAQTLFVRHYIEGFIFASLSVYCFAKGLREDRKWLGIPGALLYLLATSAKEIYVPLPFLLLLLHEKSVIIRLRRILPWLVISLAYVFWRWFMLGRFSGGYSEASTWFHNVTLLLPKITDAMGGGPRGAVPWWRWLIGSSSLLTGIVLFVTDRKSLLWVLMASPLLLLPIIPVTSIMSPRYVWLLLFFWILVHIITWGKVNKAMKRLPVRALIWSWGVLLLSGFVYVSFMNSSLTQGDIKDQGREGMFVLQQGTATDLIVIQNNGGWPYYSGLYWLRQHVLHLPEGPSVTADSKIICLERFLRKTDSNVINSFEHVWYFDPQKRTLASEDIADFCGRESLQGIKKDVPLSVKVNYSDATFSWEFGPYNKGEYALFLGQTSESCVVLPKKGKAFISFRGENLPLRLRYVSPEGWRCYSPLMTLAVTDDHGVIQWQR